MAEKTKLALFSAALAFLVTSCAGLAASTATPVPTDIPAPSATPLPLPTPTLLVDLTSDTPVPAPTVDLAGPDAWACKMRSQAVKNATRFDPKERFDMAWQVENAGLATWQPDSIRVTYFGGTRMQVNDVVSLREIVTTDRWTQFVVPMVAPRSSGKYTTVWALWHGEDDFCHMTLTIVVQ